MRVLAVTHSLGANGAAWFLCHLLVAIRAAGGSADVLHGGDEPLEDFLTANGVRIIREAQIANYDVAIVNTVIDHARVAELAINVPVVFWVHEGTATRDHEMHHAPAIQRAFRSSSRIVFDNPWQHEAVFRSYLDGIESHRISSVWPGIYLPNDDPARPPGSGGRHVISVGGVYPRKRPADILDAVLRSGLDDLHCSLIGTLNWLDANGPNLKSTLDSYPEKFSLRGELMPSEVFKQLGSADIYCSASSDETFNMAAMEAAHLGLPLALTDLPCYAGIWKHGVNALLSPVGAVDCLSWNLRALATDPALAHRLAAAAQRTASRFTMERFLSGMGDILDQATRDRLPITG